MRDGRLTVILPLRQRTMLSGQPSVSRLYPSKLGDMQALKWTEWVSPDPNAIRSSCNSLKLIALEAGRRDLTTSR